MTPSARLSYVGIAVLVLYASSLFSAPPPKPRLGRPFLGHELLGPVYPWRVPGEGGKLNLLILSHSWVTAEFAEFAKRFDCDYDLVPIWSENSLGRSYQRKDSLELWERITGILARNEYDCILITSYGSFPLHVWEAIYRECVESRAGLLIFNTGGVYSGMPRQLEADGFVGKDDFLAEVPIKAIDWTGCYDEQVEVDGKQTFTGFTTEDFPLAGKVRFATHKGKSRCVLFDWQKKGYVYWSIHHAVCPNQFFFPFGRVYPMADHLFAIAGKAMLWASQREPELSFVEVTPAEAKVEPSGRDGLRYEVVLGSNAAQDATVSVVWEVVDEGGARLSSGSQNTSLPAGGEALRLTLAELPKAGKHLYFRARLLHAGRVVDWATSHVEVDYPEDTWDLTMEQTTLVPDDEPFVARVTLRETGDVDLLRINLFDSWSRLVKRVEVAPKPGNNQVSVSAADTLGVSFRVQAQKLHEGAVTGQKEQFCTRLRVPQHRYFGIRSTSATSTVTGWYLSQLNRMYGMNFYRTKGAPLFANTLFGYSFGVYSYYGRITGPIAPDLEETYQKFVENDVLTVKPYAACLYDFGDDTGVGKGLFRSKAKTKEEKQAEEQQDWERFLGYLKTVYRDLPELCENWQVHVDSFSDLQRSQVSDEQKKKNLVPLIDYRQYQEWLYAQHLRRMRKLLTDQMPWAKSTLDGYGGIGRNLESVAAEVDSLVPYYRPQHLRELRGILGRHKSLGTVTGAYYGEDTDKRFISFIPWETLLLGGNVVWVWGTGCIAADGGISNPTYPIFESAREIGAGIGELLAAAEWDNDGVYILHCPHSSHAQEMGPKLGLTGSSSGTFSALLEEVQVGYDFIGSSKVAAGELKKRKARLLFLPFSVGMPPAAQAAVRDFVKSGGTVIADFRPATRTTHGRPVEKGGLDDLFGVRQKSVPDPIGHGTLPGSDLGTMVDRSTVVEKGSDGGNISEAPILITSRQGKGKTLLFNCFLGKYRTLLAAGRADEFTDWMAKALKKVELDLRPYGKLVPGTKVFRYERGDLHYLTIHRADISGTSERTLLRLPLGKKLHVYDVRNGGHLGQLGEIVRDVGKQEAHILALSEKPLPSFEATVRTPQVRPGETARIAIRYAGASAERLLRVDVSLPDGSPYAITGRLHWTERGQLEIRWATALTDAPAVYRLTITDIDTGQKWETGIRVTGKPFVERL